MTRKKIHVTAEDIANGEPESAYRCPVALAIARRLGVSEGQVGVAMGDWECFSEGYFLEQIALSDSANRFIHRFDDYDDGVQPFNFFTEVPNA